MSYRETYTSDELAEVDHSSTAFQERPSLPPCMREPEPKPVVHLAQLATQHPGSLQLPVFKTWCQERARVVVFDPAVATCERCLKERHDALVRPREPH